MSVEELTQQWLKWDKNPETRAEVEGLVAKGAEGVEELKKIMSKRIAFGTAGLRGPMRAGFACMNNLIVQQASQGLACSVLELVPDALKKPVVVGYDGRHHSKEFAAVTARVFAKKGFHVLLFRSIVPTPFVPYCVLQRGCAAGVMVTASHNPKQDNGYKVYWSNGCQIISPVDEHIAANIMKNLEPWDLPELDSEECKSLVSDPLDDIFERYVKDSAKNMCFTPEFNARLVAEGKAPKIVYTAMHGVGTQFVYRTVDAFKVAPLIPVKEQVEPDPEFPTVAFPNPEEGKGALALAMKTADENGAKLIIANDPDADRLALAEKQPDGNWKIFCGNEIGTILSTWVWEQYKKAHPEVKPADCCCISTAVSSGMLEKICKVEGMDYETTLTGFKWIGNAAKRHMEEKKQNFIFGYEEAIGFLIGDMSLDKDGVRSSGVMCELYYHLCQEGKSVMDYLNDQYKKYGYFTTFNRYFFCYDPAVLAKIFRRLREDKKYPTEVGRWKVKRVRDVTIGYDSGEADLKSKLPVTPGTEMITLFFENGCVCTLRGSGTEPKLKYYIELNGDFDKKAEIDAELREMVANVPYITLQPKENGLTLPKD